ncbi:EF hand family protein [Tritrichomonas foetus]|uniref:EF hand family protein n=1 Tax=Tritrichomonas foetus TaxID=1144522 RepID=A0A1J4K7C1_9EUKA|nr:EF hand family protein [Tritrichomonas foetus]|eukprot:OHT05309.1 EF hand family protein [Tritrichomonas foetus]
MNFKEPQKSDKKATRKTLPRPPTNMREKRTAHQKKRNDNYANKYLRDLRRAFDDADEDNMGSLTPEQWDSSSIRFYLKDGKMPNSEYKQYFLRIDADCDGRVTWDELVDFILLELTCMRGTQNVESKTTLNRFPVTSAIFQHKHREEIFQVVISSWTEEYITVSRESIKFWKPFPLTYQRKLGVSGPFAAVCCFKYFQLLAVATSTRTLRFFKIIELEQLPISISASPSTVSIKTMNAESARKVMKTLQDLDIPLFNIPTQMIEATLTVSAANELRFIIGDDCGCIEVFKLTMPTRRTGTDFKIDRIVSKNLHTKSISQLSLIEEMDCYASGSSDGTVKFFTIINESIHVTKVFDDGSQVLSFAFIGHQNVVAMCTMGNDPFIWSLQPIHRTFRLPGNLNSTHLVTEYISSLGERYVLTVTSKKEIRMYDSSNFVIRNEFLEVEYLPPENRITAILFDKARKILITCASYPILWVEGEVEGPRGITHQSAIVGIHYQPDFGQLLTVDSQANFMIWDYNTGHRKTIRTPKVDELCCAAIDQSGRKVITATFNGEISIWNPNSGGLIVTINDPSDSQISVVRHFTMNGRQFLLTAGWSKVVSLYQEVTPANFELMNQFRGHTSDITAAILDPNGWIITGSVTGEIFVWPIDMATKPRKVLLDCDTPVECMTTIEYLLFVGDSDGILTVFSLPNLEQVMTFKAHLAIVPHAISAIISFEQSKTLLTADSLGYVRLWEIATTPSLKMDPVKMVRAHDGEVTHIMMLGTSGKFFATAGYDLAVRIWATDSMSLIGTLSSESNWILKDMDTWAKDPLENDPRHFHINDVEMSSKLQHKEKALASSRSYVSNKNLSNTRSHMSLASAVALTSNKSLVQMEEEDEVDLPPVHFDYEQAKQMLDMIQNADTTPEARSFMDTYPPISSTKTTGSSLPLLKPDIEANDLLTQVKALQERKFKTIEEYFPEMRDKRKYPRSSLTFV